NGNDNGNGRRSNLSVVLADNSIVDLASKSGGSMSLNGMNLTSLISKPPLTNEANQLSQFLGVPLESTDVSSVSGMINTARNAWQTAGNDPKASQNQILESFNHGTTSQTSVVQPT